MRFVQRVSKLVMKMIMRMIICIRDEKRHITDPGENDTTKSKFRNASRKLWKVVCHHNSWYNAYTFAFTHDIGWSKTGKVLGCHCLSYQINLEYNINFNVQ